MGTMNMIKTIKEVHKEDIVILKIGKFYNVYGKDAYIITYLLGYKLNKISGIYSCAFPLNSLNKVMAKLEQRKINYIVIDKRNSYDVEKSSNNKNLNTYVKTLEKAKEKINYDMRVRNIVEFLFENRNDKNIILDMEQIINERRKV